MRFTLIAFIAVVSTMQPRAAEAPLTLTGTIDLPRVEGRIDHLAFDLAAERLYVAALGNNTVEVVDVKGGTRIRSLPGFRKPQGIAVVADSKSIAVANGQSDGVRFVGTDDYRPGASIRLGDDSDNVRYDATARRVYVGFASGALAAIDPAEGR